MEWCELSRLQCCIGHLGRGEAVTAHLDCGFNCRYLSSKLTLKVRQQTQTSLKWFIWSCIVGPFTETKTIHGIKNFVFVGLLDYVCRSTQIFPFIKIKE